MVQKLTGINGYDLEIPLSVHMAFFSYVDRPGVIGAVGKVLGDANVNIAGMQVSRDDETGKALVALILDNEIPADVVTSLRSRSAPRRCAWSTVFLDRAGSRPAAGFGDEQVRMARTNCCVPSELLRSGSDAAGRSGW